MLKTWHGGAALGALLLLSVPSHGRAERQDPRVGRPRWAVMTATDPGAARLPRAPTPTTIAALLAQPRPRDLPRDRPAPKTYRDRRIAPVETTLWSVEAEVVEVHHTADGDFHLLLRDPAGLTMVCELPDPSQMARPSLFSLRMTRARRALVAALQPGAGSKVVEARMRVVGLGYFGHLNPVESSARNGVQLHPVVDLQLLSGPR